MKSARDIYNEHIDRDGQVVKVSEVCSIADEYAAQFMVCQRCDCLLREHIGNPDPECPNDKGFFKVRA